MYPAGHPGHYSSLSLCFWSQGRLLQSCSSHSCLTSSAVVRSWKGRCFPIHFLSSDFREQCRFFSLSQSLFCPDTRELHSSFVLQLCLKLMHHQMRFATTSPQLQCGELRLRCGNTPLQHQGLAKTLLQVRSEHPGTFWSTQQIHQQCHSQNLPDHRGRNVHGHCGGPPVAASVMTPRSPPALFHAGGRWGEGCSGPWGSRSSTHNADSVQSKQWQNCNHFISRVHSGPEHNWHQDSSPKGWNEGASPAVPSDTGAYKGLGHCLLTQNCQSSVSENEAGQRLVPIYMGLLQN